LTLIALLPEKGGNLAGNRRISFEETVFKVTVVNLEARTTQVEKI